MLLCTALTPSSRAHELYDTAGPSKISIQPQGVQAVTPLRATTTTTAVSRPGGIIALLLIQGYDNKRSTAVVHHKVRASCQPVRRINLKSIGKFPTRFFFQAPHSSTVPPSCALPGYPVLAGWCDNRVSRLDEMVHDSSFLRQIEPAVGKNKNASM